MQRLHISVSTVSHAFQPSVDFYSALFAHPPTKRRKGYAKWQLDDPRVNFVLEVAHAMSDDPGVHHVGIEAETEDELNALRSRLTKAKLPHMDIGETVCCYSKSDKSWTADPNGVRWEAFRSFGDTDTYGARTTEEIVRNAGTG